MFRRLFLTLLVTWCAGAFSNCPLTAAQSPQPDAAAPNTGLPAPEIFSAGVISGPANDGSPTFSPDGNELYFSRSTARWSIILESHRAGGRWSLPQIATFSGTWSDASPAMSPDGTYLVFVSLRPLNPEASRIAGDQQTSSQMASHIWRVDRSGSGWSTPVELPAAVNFCARIFRPSVAADGSVYFTAMEQGKNLRLYRSLRVDGVYQRAEALSFSDGSVKDVDPEIAPDQSFLVFSSNGRRPETESHERLFVAHYKNGAWSSPVPIRYSGDDLNGDDNDPRLGPDRSTLYFASDRAVPVHFPRTKEQAAADYERMEAWDNSNTNVWSISLAPISTSSR